MSIETKIVKGGDVMDGRQIFKQFRPSVDLENLIVHHIDGDQSKNTPGNLIALTRKDHYHVHVKMGRVRENRETRPRIENNVSNLNRLVNLYNDGIYI